MKKAKKILALLLCAVLLVGASVAGTLAYLTDREDVTNTFTVGNIEIKLDEVKVDPASGKAVASGERTEDGNTDVKMIPGRTIDKDPTVWVKEGSEEAYIRMKVTISNYAALKAVFGDNFLPQDYVAGWDNSVWVTTGVITVNDDDTATYEFRYADKYTATPDDKDNTEDYDQLPALFTSFTLPGEDVNNEELAKLAGLNISVTAEAIQAETFADADAAWAAFAP